MVNSTFILSSSSSSLKFLEWPLEAATPPRGPLWSNAVLMVYCKTQTLVVKLQWNGSECHSPPSDFFGTAFHHPAEMLPLLITCFTKLLKKYVLSNTTTKCRQMVFVLRPSFRSERGGEKGGDCRDSVLHARCTLITKLFTTVITYNGPAKT